jgi:hypothetical protein
MVGGHLQSRTSSNCPQNNPTSCEIMMEIPGAVVLAFCRSWVGSRHLLHRGPGCSSMDRLHLVPEAVGSLLMHPEQNVQC